MTDVAAYRSTGVLVPSGAVSADGEVLSDNLKWLVDWIKDDAPNAALAAMGYINLADYAVGDGVIAHDGAADAADILVQIESYDLTVADVGKVLILNGAGAGGADFVTTITGIDSIHIAEVADAIVTAVSGATVHFGTDCTAGIQAAINAAYNAQKKLWVPQGIYMIAGALVDDAGVLDGVTSGNATWNAQINLPARSPFLQIRTLTIEGEQAPGSAYWPFAVGDYATMKPTSIGSIFVSTCPSGGTKASIFGAPIMTQGFGYSMVMLELKNVVVRGIDNNAVRALNLQNQGSVLIDNIIVDTTRQSYKNTQPASTNSIGIFMPDEGNAARCIIRNSYVTGYYCGYRLGEHSNMESGWVQGCWHGIRFGPITGRPHNIRIGHAIVGTCPYGLVWEQTGAGVSVFADAISFERSSVNLFDPDGDANWQDVVYDVDDVGNYGFGRINWTATRPNGGVGVAGEISIRGAEVISLPGLGSHSVAINGSRPANGDALTAIGAGALARSGGDFVVNVDINFSVTPSGAGTYQAIDLATLIGGVTTAIPNTERFIFQASDTTSFKTTICFSFKLRLASAAEIILRVRTAGSTFTWHADAGYGRSFMTLRPAA